MVLAQLNTFTPVGTAISMRRVHEEQLAHQRHADHEHVVRPDDERQERDTRRGVDHRAIAEQRLAREGRNDLRRDAEAPAGS